MDRVRGDKPPLWVTSSTLKVALAFTSIVDVSRVGCERVTISRRPEISCCYCIHKQGDRKSHLDLVMKGRGLVAKRYLVIVPLLDLLTEGSCPSSTDI